MSRSSVRFWSVFRTVLFAVAIATYFFTWLPLTSTGVTAQAAGGPVWLTPAIDLIKYFVDKFKPSKDQKMDMASKTAAIDADAKQLSPLPRFLQEAREFRLIAIELAQTIRIAADDEIWAARLWKTIVLKTDEAKRTFETAFGTDAVRNLLLGSTELQRADAECRDSLRRISDKLQTIAESDSPKIKLNALQTLLGELNSLTEGAQMPEYVTVQASNGVVTHYSELAADLKKATSSSALSPQIGGGVLVPASFFPQIREGEPEQGDTRVPEFLKKMREEIAQPAEPPAWLRVLTETSRRVVTEDSGDVIVLTSGHADSSAQPLALLWQPSRVPWFAYGIGALAAIILLTLILGLSARFCPRLLLKTLHVHLTPERVEVEHAEAG